MFLPLPLCHQSATISVPSNCPFCELSHFCDSLFLLSQSHCESGQSPFSSTPVVCQEQQSCLLLLFFLTSPFNLVDVHHCKRNRNCHLYFVTLRDTGNTLFLLLFKVPFILSSLTLAHCLTGLPHPPLFACVLQKVNAVHRLECHLFVCLTADDAIRMCASVAEHRRRGGAVGRLQLPMPGTMGSYSYAPSLSSTLPLGSRMAPSSSSAISVISNRSLDISSSATTFIRNSSSHAFSDIEEGEEGDEGGRIRRTREEAQLRPPFAITQQHSTSALKMAALFQGRAVNDNHYPPHHPSSSERDLPVQR